MIRSSWLKFAYPLIPISLGKLHQNSNISFRMGTLYDKTKKKHLAFIDDMETIDDEAGEELEMFMVKVILNKL